MVEPVTSGDEWVALRQPRYREPVNTDWSTDQAQTGAVGGPRYRREPMGKNSSPDGSYYTEENRSFGTARFSSGASMQSNRSERSYSTSPFSSIVVVAPSHVHIQERQKERGERKRERKIESIQRRPRAVTEEEKR